MVIAVSLIVLLVGLLMYALSANPKLQEIGRIMFAFGLLAFLFRLASETLNIFR